MRIIISIFVYFFLFFVVEATFGNVGFRFGNRRVLAELCFVRLLFLFKVTQLKSFKELLRFDGC